MQFEWLQQTGPDATSSTSNHPARDAVIAAADELGVDVRCIQKVSEEEEEDLPRLQFTSNNGAILAAIGTSSHVAGGTAWLYSSLRTERTSGKNCRTGDQAKADVFDYIERFYNPRRRHSTLGYLSPIESENRPL